jgi:hypothetical protein
MYRTVLALILKWKRGTDIDFVASVSLCFSRHAKHVGLVQLAGFIEDNVIQLFLEYSLRRDVDLHTYIIVSFHNPSHNGAVPSPTPAILICCYRSNTYIEAC